MRDPKRIPIILKELETIWLANPELRFFQFITFLLTLPVSGLFYMEDDIALKNLKRLNKAQKEKKLVKRQHKS